MKNVGVLFLLYHGYSSRHRVEEESQRTEGSSSNVLKPFFRAFRLARLGGGKSKGSRSREGGATSRASRARGAGRRCA